MTLDADTRMMRDAVDRLVGKLCHPLNRPVIDAATGKVTAGYSILQPRVTPSLTTGDEASFLQRVFSANRGIDPYVFAVSDLYQDVFGEGSFTGKGLYHIDAMEAALDGRIARKRGAQPRPARRLAGAFGAGDRCRGGRGLSDPLFGRRIAPAPLGARRLAAAAATSSIPSRACRRCRAGR